MTTTQNLIEQLRAMVALTNETPRIPALPRSLATSAADRLSEMDAELRRIEENLGEYIDRVELVDVAVALAFETARAALEHQQKGEKL